MLNLGCGADIRQSPGPGWVVVNHDRLRFDPGVDEVWDLNRLPWPWVSDSIHTLIAQSVLEHLHLNLVQSLNECWRILMPGGRLDIKLPLWNAEVSYADPTHYRVYAVGILDNFDPDRLRWVNGQRYGCLPWRVDYQAAWETSLFGRMYKRVPS